MPQSLRRFQAILRSQNALKDVQRCKRTKKLPYDDALIVPLYGKCAKERMLQRGHQPTEGDEQGVLDDAQGGVHVGGEKMVYIIYIVGGKQPIVVRGFDAVQPGAGEQAKERRIAKAHQSEKADSQKAVTCACHGVHSSSGTKTKAMSPGVS